MKIFLFLLLIMLAGMDNEFANDVGIIRSYTMDTIYVEAKLPSMWIEQITAYSPSIYECDSLPFITFTEDSVRMGCVAADPKVIPMHSLLIIPGYNDGKVCEVLDTGSKIKGRKLDVFFWTKNEAVQYGLKRNKRILIVRWGG